RGAGAGGAGGGGGPGGGGRGRGGGPGRGKAAGGFAGAAKPPAAKQSSAAPRVEVATEPVKSPQLPFPAFVLCYTFREGCLPAPGRPANVNDDCPRAPPTGEPRPRGAAPRPTRGGTVPPGPAAQM